MIKPDVSDALIAYLKDIYPDRLPRKYPGEFALGQLFGSADVVRHLEDLHKEQRENILSSRPKEIDE